MICPGFLRKRHLKKEKSILSGSQTQLNDIANEHTIISRQLFAGLMVDSRPMKRKKNLHQMINNFSVFFFKHACLSSPYLMKYDRLLFCIINVYSIAT